MGLSRLKSMRKLTGNGMKTGLQANLHLRDDNPLNMVALVVVQYVILTEIQLE